MELKCLATLELGPCQLASGHRGTHSPRILSTRYGQVGMRVGRFSIEIGFIETDPARMGFFEFAQTVEVYFEPVGRRYGAPAPAKAEINWSSIGATTPEETLRRIEIMQIAVRIARKVKKTLDTFSEEDSDAAMKHVCDTLRF